MKLGGSSLTLVADECKRSPVRMEGTRTVWSQWTHVAGHRALASRIETDPDSWEQNQNWSG